MGMFVYFGGSGGHSSGSEVYLWDTQRHLIHTEDVHLNKTRAREKKSRHNFLLESY